MPGASENGSHQPHFVRDQHHVAGKEPLQNGSHAHDPKHPLPGHCDKHDDADTRQRHFEDSEVPGVVLEEVCQHRVDFHGTVGKQSQREKCVRDTQHDDHERQEQKLGLMPIDNAVELVLSPATPTTWGSTAPKKGLKGRSSPLTGTARLHLGIQGR